MDDLSYREENFLMSFHAVEPVIIEFISNYLMVDQSKIVTYDELYKECIKKYPPYFMIKASDRYKQTKISFKLVDANYKLNSPLMLEPSFIEVVNKIIHEFYIIFQFIVYTNTHINKKYHDEFLKKSIHLEFDGSSKFYPFYMPLPEREYALKERDPNLTTDDRMKLVELKEELDSVSDIVKSQAVENHNIIKNTTCVGIFIEEC